MPIMRKLVKFAVGYAVAKALARKGGPMGLLDSVLGSSNRSGGRDTRGAGGADRNRNGTGRRRRG